MKNNFIKILPDSVQLYGNWLDDSNQYDVIKSFKKGGLTYTIVNDNIKFYAYNDYFYKNCIMSYDLPVTINDVSYSSIDEITDALNDIYPDDNNSGEGGGSIDVDDHLSTVSTNPVQNKIVTQVLNGKADKSEIPSLNGYATEDWVEGQGYLKEHQDLSDYAKKNEVPTLPEFRTINGQKITGDTSNIVIEGGSGGETITIDSELSTTSTNPVQNKAITNALNNKANLSDIPSLTGYATQTWVEEQGYLKEEQDKLSAGTGIKIENNVVSAKIWQGTKAEYNAITSKDSDTIYLIYE